MATQNFPTTVSVCVVKNGGTLTCTQTGGNTLEEAVGRAAESLAFYRSYDNNQPSVEWAERTCRQCSGSGKVHPKRQRHMFHQVTCPACKGKNSTVDVLPEVLAAIAAMPVTIDA